MICCILSSCLVVFVSPRFLGNYKLVLGFRCCYCCNDRLLLLLMLLLLFFVGCWLSLVCCC